MLKLLESPWDDVIHPLLVMIEDSNEDFYTFWRLVQKLAIFENTFYNLLRFEDGDEALDYLLREGDFETLEGARPKLVLLDLNLPGTDGRDIIKQVRQVPHLKSLPLIVLSTSHNQQDIESCYANGANGYVLKQVGVQAMQETLQVLISYWFTISALPDPI
ncbi:MAG: response regulator [Prochlorotrichaceae cyanobacterium]